MSPLSIPSFHSLPFLPFFLLTDISKPPTHYYHHPLPANIEYKGHNYKVVSGNLTWYDAMNMCKENDSDLVSITDAYHQAFLTVLVNRLGVPHWIGLYSQEVCILYRTYVLYLCIKSALYLCPCHCVCVISLHRLVYICKLLSRLHTVGSV